MNDEVRPLPVFVSEKATVTYIKVRPPCDSDSTDVRRLCFPMTPRLSPSRLHLAPLCPFPRSRPLPLAPLSLRFSSYSPRPFHASPFSSVRLPLSLFFSLLRTLFPLSLPLPPSRHFFFTSLDVGAKRDASLQSFERSADRVAHLAAIFIRAPAAPSPDTRLRGRSSLFLILSARCPIFLIHVRGLSLLHARTDVPYALYLTRVYVRTSACTSPRVFRAAYPPSRQPVS